MATTTTTTAAGGYPRVLLFDIGGVCVISPFQAILDYEKSHNIPLGYINHAISASGPTGAWAKIETGAIPLDEEFFRLFKADLEHEARWKAYYLKSTTTATTTTTAGGKVDQNAEVPSPPPVPNIDAKWLFGEMMRIARTPDPHMWPALQKLRKAADASNGELVLAALSNTVIFPRGHEFNDDDDEKEEEEHPEQQKDQKKKDQQKKSSDSKTNEIRTLKTQIFDLFLSSAHIGLRKPDERIYQYAATRLQEYIRLQGKKGVRMQDVTFLDDIGTNLRTARKLGMNTIKVTLGRADLAVRELEILTGLELGGKGLEGRGKARL